MNINAKVAELNRRINAVNEMVAEIAEGGYNVEYETIDVSPIGRTEYPALRAVVSKTETITGLGVDNENES